MNPLLLVLIAVIGFLGYCMAKDHYHGGTDSFWSVMCRVIAKNVKLALKIVFVFVAGFFTIMAIFSVNAEGAGAHQSLNAGGPESEKFFRFMNRATYPLQAALDGAMMMLGVLAFCVVFGAQWFVGFYYNHIVICYVILAAIYLVWLWFNTRDIVANEYTDYNESKDVVRSTAAMLVWLVLLAASFHYILYPIYHHTVSILQA